MPGNPLAAYLDAAVRGDAARPLLTFYDDATGERVELSVTTTANWVAKTASFLVDGLGREPGDAVAVLLPVHWQTAIAVLAGWAAGLEVRIGGDPAGADVVLAAEAQLARALDAGAEDVVGFSLSAFGAPLAAVPQGVVDYATEVLGHADRFATRDLPDPALVAGKRAYPGAELAASVAAGVRRWQLGPDDAVLTTLPYDTVHGLLAGLLAPLAAGARVVLCRHPDPQAVERRVGVERVTAAAGFDVTGIDVAGIDAGIDVRGMPGLE